MSPAYATMDVCGVLLMCVSGIMLAYHWAHACRAEWLWSATWVGSQGRANQPLPGEVRYRCFKLTNATISTTKAQPRPPTSLTCERTRPYERQRPLLPKRLPASSRPPCANNVKRRGSNHRGSYPGSPTQATEHMWDGLPHLLEYGWLVWLVAALARFHEWHWVAWLVDAHHK